MIGAPPSEAGADQVSATAAFWAVPATPVGAPGGDGGGGGAPAVKLSRMFWVTRWTPALTIDVPPMSRQVIEFYANEDRDWLFHCHLLYHMKAGMARVVSYPAGDEMRAAASSTPASADSSAAAQRSASAPAYRPALDDKEQKRKAVVKSHLDALHAGMLAGLTELVRWYRKLSAQPS